MKNKIPIFFTWIAILLVFTSCTGTNPTEEMTDADSDMETKIAEPFTLDDSDPADPHESQSPEQSETNDGESSSAYYTGEWTPLY